MEYKIRKQEFPVGVFQKGLFFKKTWKIDKQILKFLIGISIIIKKYTEQIKQGRNIDKQSF